MHLAKWIYFTFLTRSLYSGFRLKQLATTKLDQQTRQRTRHKGK